MAKGGDIRAIGHWAHIPVKSCMPSGPDLCHPMRIS